jgi:uncharacterized 2Fe-2S/4Fe-4S cluster protein (DUF4445 family)
MNYRVLFKPDEMAVSVERGTKVLDAAVKAGVDLNSSCGGKGTCKKCKVIVEGPTETDSKSKIDQEMMDKGYRLACQTYVAGDIMVFVPEEARLRQHQIMEGHGEHRLEALSPLTLALTVELSPPDLVDNLADLERLGRYLDPEEGRLAMPLEVLRELPKALRSFGWKLPLIREWADLGGGIVAIGQTEGCNYGAAVDIGTTTVVLSLIDLVTGKTVATASEYNRQSKAGDDVISRIAHSEEGGLKELQDLVIQTINHLLMESRASAGKLIGECEITAMSVAGNTTMMHLFLGLDPRHIRYEPYIPVTNIPPIVKAKELDLGINPNSPVYCLPGRASFVGGDITADVVFSGMREREELALLIDVGTNGEVALGNGEFLVSCSTSAGPAFEGGEVASGMRAMVGAIERISISEGLEVSTQVIGDRPALGICGSGLIDLVAQLFLRGVIDKKGRIGDLRSKGIQTTDEGKRFIIQERRAKGKEIAISDADLANIIRTKAAVYAGCSVLLRSLDKSFSELGKVYIAGGFGNYIDVENAILIGLLPDLPRERFQFIGNAALGGAVQALLSEEKRKDATQVYEDMTYIELTNSPTFFDEFSSASFLPHTEISRFPSVRQALAAAKKRK